MSEAYVHPLALVETTSIGDGTRVWAFAHVQPDAVIGSGCNICDHCFIERGVRIGNDVVIKNGVSVWSGVTLENRVFVGPNAVFTNDTIPRAKLYHDVPEPTLVCEGASIGANATLLCGITIGRYALIGAGAVVTKPVPSFAVLTGNPARLVGYRCACTRTLPGPGEARSYQCECGRRFSVNETSLEELR